MDWLTSPVSIIGILGIAAALQKSGVDVVGVVRWLFNQHKKGEQQEIQIDADNRNVAQSLLSQMEVLTQHFNHETTELLEKVVEKLGEIHDCLKAANRKLDEQEKYGVKVRKE